ncbi:MAG: hypothetical protein KDG50_12290 [Chromatiales bacterium]|nr:hypothetical protein [Chromatiales bacterium]
MHSRSRGRTRATLAILALLTTLVAPGAFAQPDIVLVYSQGSSFQTRIAESIGTRLRADGLSIELATIPASALPATTITAALGTQATDHVVRMTGRAPDYAAFVSRFELATNTTLGQTRHVFTIDQPLSRQLGLIETLLPQARRIAVVLGPSSSDGLRRLRAAAGTRLAVVAAQANDASELGPALDTVLGDADAYLAMPDETLHNSDTAHSVLLSAYRRGIPVVAFSRAFVRAGALAAVFSEPAQIESQIIADLKALLENTNLPRQIDPREFAIEINARVAAALHLTLPDLSVITEALRNLEPNP